MQRGELAWLPPRPSAADAGIVATSWSDATSSGSTISGSTVGGVVKIIIIKWWASHGWWPLVHDLATLVCATRGVLW